MKSRGSTGSISRRRRPHRVAVDAREQTTFAPFDFDGARRELAAHDIAFAFERCECNVDVGSRQRQANRQDPRRARDRDRTGASAGSRRAPCRASMRSLRIPAALRSAAIAWPTAGYAWNCGRRSAASPHSPSFAAGIGVMTCLPNDGALLRGDRRPAHRARRPSRHCAMLRRRSRSPASSTHRASRPA